MKRLFLPGLALAVVAAGAGFSYQAAARDRDYRALVLRGDRALSSEQTFVAVEAYSGAIALRPDSMLGYLRRGETYLRRGDRGDLEQAVHDLRRATALDPAAGRVLERLGDVLYQLGRYADAADSYARLRKLDDRSERAAYKLAQAHYTAGSRREALAELDNLLRLSERNADAHYLRGMCLRDGGDGAGAVRAFERALTLAPLLVAAREELADLHGVAGRYTEQLKELRGLAVLEPSLDRQMAIARALARSGQPDAAVRALRAALDQTSERPRVYAALGRIWLDVALERNDRVALSKAVVALARAVDEPGSTSPTLTAYAQALIRQGQWDPAERVLLRAAAQFPVDPQAFALLSLAAERQQHLEAARDALIKFDALVDDDRDRAEHAARIGRLSLRLRDPQTAARWLAKAAAASPRDVNVLTSLADVQIALGDSNGARETVAHGLSVQPNSPTFTALNTRLRRQETSGGPR